MGRGEQASLDQELTGQNITHSWLGATLVVRAADEEDVDKIIDATDETGGPVLDPEAEKIAYEVEGWAADEQTAFSEMLARLGIPHEFDQAGDLLVLVEDEDAVEAALDAFQASLMTTGQNLKALMLTHYFQMFLWLVTV